MSRAKMAAELRSGARQRVRATPDRAPGALPSPSGRRRPPGGRLTSLLRFLPAAPAPAHAPAGSADRSGDGPSRPAAAPTDPGPSSRARRRARPAMPPISTAPVNRSRPPGADAAQQVRRVPVPGPRRRPRVSPSRRGGPAAAALRAFAGLALALLVVPALLFVAPSAAQAQTTYVSNLGNATSTAFYIVGTSKLAQIFATGAQAGGYPLGSVDIHFYSIDGDQRANLSVEFWSATGTGLGATPNAKLFDLTVPASIETASSSTLSFAAPTGTTLDSSTSYAVVLAQSGSSRASMMRTTDTTESAETGWTIQDRWQIRSSSTWSPQTLPFMIAVKGTGGTPTPTNNAATGAPGIDGAPQMGQTLTATAGNMADADDLPTTTFPDGYSFQWVRVEFGGNVTDIPGATSSTYTPVFADLGSTIKVRVSFTDGGGTQETLESAATDDAVVPTQRTCPAGNDWCATMTVGIDVGSLVTRYGYDTGVFAGNYGGLDDTTINYGGQSYTVSGVVFGDASTTYTYQVKLDAFVPRGSTFNLYGEGTANSSSEQTTTGLYEWNASTNPGWIEGQKVRVSANLAPFVTGATVDGDELVLTFAENLDTNSKPAGSAFTVSAAGTAVTVSNVGMSGDTVTLTLASAVTSDQTVTVAYAVPATNPLQDTSDIEAPAFAAGDFTVTNNTPPNNAATGKPGIDGAPQVGQTLTATAGDMDDDDNLPATTFPMGYSFQWVRVNSSNNETDIGTDSHEYDPVAADVGNTIKVKVTFTDGGGTVETLESDETDAVVAALGACPANNDWCAVMTVGTATGTGVLSGQQYYGYKAAATTYVSAFGALDNDAITQGGETWTVEDINYPEIINIALSLTLDASVPFGSVFNFGGTELEANFVTESSDGEFFWSLSTSPGWLEGQQVRVSANLAPFVTGATVSGDQLVLTFAEDLDTTSKPAAGAFMVTVDSGTAAAPDSVDTISGKTVTMTLATAVTTGQTVTVSYTVPTSNPLQDASGIEAPAFAAGDFTVTNNTGVTNNAATGAPGIDGTPQVGQTLTATAGTMADADNLPSGTFPTGYSFQWVRVNSSSVETDISGATSSTYVLAAADVGNTIKVEVSFTDGGGTEETLPSDATDAVVAAAAACPSGNDWCAEMTVGEFSQLSTFHGYRSGTGGTFGSLDDTGIEIEYGEETWTVSGLYFEDGPIADSFFIDLDAFVPRGSVFDLGGTELTANSSSEHPTTGRYQWDVTTGPGWLDGQQVRVSANLAPFVTYATVNGDQLLLRFAEVLKASSTPVASAFSVSVDGGAGVAPSSVDSIFGPGVTLTLASAVTNRQTVTVSYTPPGTDPLQDESGVNAPGFTDEAAFNTTPGATTVATVVGFTDSSVTLDIGDATRLHVYDGFTGGTCSGGVLASYTPASGETTVVVNWDGSSNRAVVLQNATICSSLAGLIGSYRNSVAPENVGLVSAGSESLTVTWDAPDPGSYPVSKYEIQYSKSTDDLSLGQTITHDGASLGGGVEITGLDPSTSYQLRVRAGDFASALYPFDGLTGWSQTFSASTGVANTPATGTPEITGTATVGQTLTAGVSGITDADGVPTNASDFTYQWVRVDADGTSNPVDVGIDSSNYSLVAADGGKKIKVEVSFTDDGGNSEGPLESAAYPSGNATVAPADSTVPAISIFVDGASTVTEGADAAFKLWRTGTTSGELEVKVRVSEDGDVVATGDEGDKTVAFGIGSQTATFRVATQDDTVAETDSVVTVAIVVNLRDPDAPYTHGPFFSQTVTVEDDETDVTGPEVSSATLLATGGTIKLNLSEATTFPGAVFSGNLIDAFTVTADGQDVGISWIVAQSARYFEISLQSNIGSTVETVVLSYDQDAAGAEALADPDGNEMASFTLALRGSITDTTAPTVSYTAPTSLTVGLAITPVTPSTTDTDIASYSATGLPDGLSIDTTTGVIGGTPTTATGSASTVTVTVTDTSGNSADVPLTFPAVEAAPPTNTAATGTPGITGVPQSGRTLTATLGTIDDDDGLTSRTFPDDYSFKWFQDGTEIGGATGATYALTDADVGAEFSVQVSFTDDAGNAEGPLESAATDAVVAALGACPTGNDWCATLTVGTAAGTPTYYGYDDGEVAGQLGGLDDTTIDHDVRSYSVGAVLFADSANDFFTLALDAFVPRGSVFDLGGTELTAGASSEQSTTGRYSWSASADPGWIEGRQVRVSANLAPVVTAATVDGDQLVLTFAEDLDPGSRPAASAFTVSVDGATGAAPSSVDTITGQQVTLTLASAVTSGQTVTVSYAVPTTNPLQDTSGIEAPGFTAGDFTVTNNTGAASTDATLSALALTDGDGTAITLSPIFASGTKTYTASVGNAVDTVTIAPTANDSDAEWDILDGRDTVLSDADADAANGFQVALDEGANPVKVKVTAEDDTTTVTYTVTVTRAAAVLPGGSVLVSTFGQSRNQQMFASTFQSRGQQFTVGPDDDYTLTEVTVHVDVVNAGGGIGVAIHAVDGDRWATPALHTLTAPSGTSAGPRTFTARAGATLEKGTSYFVVVTSSSATSRRLGATDLDAEDAASLSGWSVADNSRIFVSGGIWGNSTNALLMQLNGVAKSPTNTAATGRPGITGTPQVGQTLTATTSGITDPDGVPATAPDFTFQWVRVDADGTNPADISGATSSTYVPVGADAGKKLKVKVTFTDNAGNAEGPLESDATAGAVVAARGACPTGNDWCATMTVGQSQSDRRKYGFNDGTIESPYGGLDDTIIEHGGETRTLERITFFEGLVDSLIMHLDAFVPRGSVFNLGGTELTADADSESKSVNGEGIYIWSPSINPGWIVGQLVRVSANLAPVVTAATVDGDQLVLTFAEDLDPTSRPAPGAFTVSVDGATGAAPSSADTITGKTVTLTLASAVTSGQTVTVSYAVPGTNPLRDASGLAAPAFTDRAVTNTTAATTAATGRPGITGTPQVGRTLTAELGTIDDDDGLPATTFPQGYTFQWYRVDADGTSNRTAITGATAATHTLADADENAKVVVEVSFADAGGNAEGPLASEAYPAGNATVTAPGPASVLLDTTLTVGGAGSYRGCSTPNSYSPCEDNMAPRTFVSTDAGGATREFTIRGLHASDFGAGELAIWFEDLKELRDYDIDNLALELDGTQFRFRSADAGLTIKRLWRNAGLDWNIGDTVAVRILDLRVAEQEAAEPLTVEVQGAPESHDGANPFTFRLAFSEDVAVEPDAMRDHALLTSGGTVTAAARVDGRSDLWELTIEPAGNGPVGIVVPKDRLCTEPGALCTSEGQSVSESVAHSIPWAPPVQEQQAPVDPGALTASFRDAPEEHDGASIFPLELAFTEAVFDGTEPFDKNQAIQDTLQVTGGTVKGRRRVAPGAFDRWLLRIEPAGHGDVTVTLPATTGGCDAAGAICTPDGKPLSNAPTATVQGPPGLSIADAEVHEGPGAALAFAVTLSRASSFSVTVDYATADETATAGADYTATSGTLTFLAGETAKTVAVPVIDDVIDEGSETLTLTLANPSGGNAWLADATATGTIRNSGLMPQAWLARFGRTVAEQIVDAVQDRLQAPPAPGVQVTLAGERIGGAAKAGGEEDPGAARRKALEEAEAKRKLAALSAWLHGEAGAEGPDRRAEYRPVEPRDLLTGSAFQLTTRADGIGGGLASLWGRGAFGSFDGRDGELSVSGEVNSALLGADWTGGPGSPDKAGAGAGAGKWTAGLMLSHARGTGRYRGASGDGPGGGGEVESTVTGLYPYGRYQMTDRVTVWGTAGYGAGTLTLTPDPAEGADPGARRARLTDMDLMMAAAGLRGTVVKAPADGGPEVAVETDALAVRTRSEARHADAQDGGHLAAATGDATRLRLGLEGTWRGLALGGGTLEPRLELGLRHDGGDAETGFGLDAGAGLAWADPRNGLRLQLSGRGLLSHESKGFREQGVAGSLSWQPRPERGRGPKLTLTRTLGGASSGGTGALLGQRTLAGLGANDTGDPLESRRLEVGFGYGFAVLGDRFTSTPEIGLGMSNGHREYRLGWRLTLARSATSALELALEASRREAVNDNGAGAEPEHTAGFRVTARW